MIGDMKDNKAEREQSVCGVRWGFKILLRVMRIGLTEKTEFE